MGIQQNFLRIVLAWIALVSALHGAEPTGDPEMRWAPAPEFWDRVQAVLNDKPVFDWNGRYGRYHRVEDRTKDNLQWVQKLRRVPFPKLKDLPRVKVYADLDYPTYFVAGSLIADREDTWYVFSNRWRLERIKRVPGAKIEDSDIVKELKAVRDYGQAFMDTKPGDPVNDAQATIHRFHFGFLPHHGGVDFILMAYLANEEGRADGAEALIREAFFYSGDALKETFDAMAWELFEPAVIDLNEGAKRAEIAMRFRRIEREFPGGQYEGQAKQYADTLEKMAIEDAAFKEPQDANKLPAAEQVKIEIFRLRDCHARQLMQPGSCGVIASWDFSYGADLNAADRLVLLGFDAVPALIESLNDTRLTRSYGFDRDFVPQRDVLEIRDAALQTLQAISGERFSPPWAKSYLSDKADDVRDETIRHAKDWWNKARTQGESAWLRSKLKVLPGAANAPYGDGGLLIRRLAKIEGQKALPDVKAWIKANSYIGELGYELRMQARDPDVEAEIQERSRPNPRTFDLAALNVMHEHHKITDQEFNDNLYNACAAIVKSDPARLNMGQSFALLRMGDARSALVVGEALRGGWRDLFDTRLVTDPAIGWKLAPYLVPYFYDLPKHDPLAKPGAEAYEAYRSKIMAAPTLNNIIGRPIDSESLRSDTQRDDAISELKKYCVEKGIKPAFSRPKFQPDKAKESH